MKFLLSLFVLTLGKLYFIPTTYYVTPSGSGSGTGLDSGNTMSYAALFSKTLVSGDIVKFKGGNTYQGQHFAKDGVTYDRYSAGTNPVISGSTTLTTWALASGNIYWASVSSTQPQSVTLDGALVGMGRYPNTGYLTYTSHVNNTSISGASVGTLPTTFVGGEVVIRKARFIMDRHIITAQSGTTITYSSTNFYGNSSNYDPDNGNGYFVQNHLDALDQLGEWYYDKVNSRLYMHFGTGTPAGRVVKAATVSQLVPLNSTANVTFNNIDFEGGNTGIQNNGTTNITFNNCNFRYQGTAIYGNDCTNLTMNGGSISDCGSNGFNVESSNVANITGTTVTGVTIKRTGLIAGLGESGDARYSAINVGGNNTTVTNCTVIKQGFNGISFDGDNVLVKRNLVDSSCLVKDDGAGIYTFSLNNVTRSNRIIEENIVLHSIGNYLGGEYNGELYGQAAAIYLDGFANHVILRYNFCAGGSWMGIFENGNSSNSIVDNTTFDFPYGIAITQTATTGFGSVRNLVMTGNTCIARTASQMALLVTILFASDNPSSFGTNINNNLYGRPLDDNLTIRVNRGSYPGATGVTDISLATWKSTSGLDSASSKASVTTSNVNNLRYDYNYSPSSIPLSLGAVYKNISNTSYPGIINLSPYRGEVLIYSGALPTGYIIIKAGPFKFVSQ